MAGTDFKSLALIFNILQSGKPVTWEAVKEPLLSFARGYCDTTHQQASGYNSEEFNELSRNLINLVIKALPEEQLHNAHIAVITSNCMQGDLNPIKFFSKEKRHDACLKTYDLLRSERLEHSSRLEHIQGSTQCQKEEKLAALQSAFDNVEFLPKEEQYAACFAIIDREVEYFSFDLYVKVVKHAEGAIEFLPKEERCDAYLKLGEEVRYKFKSSEFYESCLKNAKDCIKDLPEERLFDVYFALGDLQSALDAADFLPEEKQPGAYYTVWEKANRLCSESHFNGDESGKSKYRNIANSANRKLFPDTGTKDEMTINEFLELAPAQV